MYMYNLYFQLRSLTVDETEDFEDQEKEIEKAAAEERERRKELGMDFDKAFAGPESKTINTYKHHVLVRIGFLGRLEGTASYGPL